MCADPVVRVVSHGAGVSGVKNRSLPSRIRLPVCGCSWAWLFDLTCSVAVEFLGGFILFEQSSNNVTLL